MAEHAPDRVWSGIDIPKTIAGTLAAVSAAVIGSYLGVAGTLIGAAVASVIGSVGTELYARFIKRGSSKIKSTFVAEPAAVGTPPVAAAAATVPSEEPAPTAPAKIRWGRIAGIAGALFVLAMGSLTAFELISGESVPAAVGHETSSTTTFCSAFCGKSEGGPTTAPSESGSPSPAADKDQPRTTEPSVEPTGTAPQPTEPTAPVQTGGTDPGTAPTDQPTDGDTQPGDNPGDSEQQPLDGSPQSADGTE
ncbi:MAG TPA: hypothetical protein VFG35_25760 [Actinoplanes sp.]|nr:hypothetical protein [Actinoplanes sp.]